ncbi:MAG: tetratricopeptide repeat protein [Gammaproteobacteria bacterium]
MALLCAGVLVTGLMSWAWPRLDRPPTRFEIAQALLEEGRPEDALLLFEDPVWRGIAEYRAGRYTRAVGQFFPAETTLELYNMGTAFARLEEWAGAIGMFETVLRLDPEHDDARHNLQIVLEAAELKSALAVQSDEGPQLKQEGGDQRQMAQTEEGNPTDSKQSGAQDNESTSASSRAGDPGTGDDPGQIDEQEATNERGTAVASGDLGEPTDSTLERELGHAADIKARESAQAAEILLRQIRDDPERVLRVRLYAANRARRRAGQGRAGQE